MQQSRDEWLLVNDCIVSDRSRAREKWEILHISEVYHQTLKEKTDIQESNQIAEKNRLVMSCKAMLSPIVF